MTLDHYRGQVAAESARRRALADRRQRYQPETTELDPIDPTDALVCIRRPDGSEFLLRVALEHLPRLMDLAAGEFGDRTIVLDGQKNEEAHVEARTAEMGGISALQGPGASVDKAASQDP